MMGVMLVTSERSLTNVRDLFVTKHLDGEHTQSKKQLWINLCIVKAAIKIVKGKKMKKSQLHLVMAKQ